MTRLKIQKFASAILKIQLISFDFFDQNFIFGGVTANRICQKSSILVLFLAVI